MKALRHPAEPEHEGDAALVLALRAGRLTAADALFRRHGARILRLCTRLLAHREEAEDAAHDAFVKAIERLASLREPDRFGAWLGSIAVSEVRQRLRRRRILGMLGFTTLPPDIGLDQLVGPSVPPSVRMELGEVQRVLDRLPTEARIAWMLRRIQGHTPEEVADLLRTSLATAKRRIQVADHAIETHVSMEVFDAK